MIGDVKLSNVQFVYPSRTDVSVLNGLSLTAQRGQTTALVGSSGCGKVNILKNIDKFRLNLLFSLI